MSAERQTRAMMDATFMREGMPGGACTGNGVLRCVQTALVVVRPCATT